PGEFAWAGSFLVSYNLRSAITGACPRQVIVFMASKHVGIYISPRCTNRIQLRLDGPRWEAGPILETREAFFLKRADQLAIPNKGGGGVVAIVNTANQHFSIFTQLTNAVRWEAFYPSRSSQPIGF